MLGDGEGGALVVGERECSVQRRHQKLLEESPSPFLSEDTRQALYAAALGAVRATRYRNAGTIECLLGGDQSFYFMEMNTRLQVEHPVSEEVTGIDLVRTQLRLAMGEPLPAAGHRADARPRDRVPHQRRGPGARVHAVARAAAPLPAAARPRRARRHARLRGLHGAADLRLARGQADRLRRRRGPRRSGAPRRRSPNSRSRASSTTLPLFREMVDERAGVPGRCVHDRLPRGGGGAAILAVRVMTDTPPRAVSRRQARRAAFVLTYQLDVRAGSDLDELAVALPRRYGHGRAGLHARGRRGRAARPRRDRRRRRRGRGRLDGRPPGRGRARDPAARDLGAAPAASCPAAVVIDEAMELAKRYAGAEAAPFVNGVLGAIARGGEAST